MDLSPSNIQFYEEKNVYYFLFAYLLNQNIKRENGFWPFNKKINKCVLDPAHADQ